MGSDAVVVYVAAFGDGRSSDSVFTARRFQFTKAEPILALDVIANGSLLALFVLSFFPLTMVQLGQPVMLVAGVAQLIRFYVGSLGVW